MWFQMGRLEGLVCISELLFLGFNRTSGMQELKVNTLPSIFENLWERWVLDELNLEFTSSSSILVKPP